MNIAFSIFILFAIGSDESDTILQQHNELIQNANDARILMNRLRQATSARNQDPYFQRVLEWQTEASRQGAQQSSKSCQELDSKLARCEYNAWIRECRVEARRRGLENVPEIRNEFWDELKYAVEDN